MNGSSYQNSHVRNKSKSGLSQAEHRVTEFGCINGEGLIGDAAPSMPHIPIGNAFYLWSRMLRQTIQDSALPRGTCHLRTERLERFASPTRQRCRYPGHGFGAYSTATATMCYRTSTETRVASCTELRPDVGSRDFPTHWHTICTLGTL